MNEVKVVKKSLTFEDILNASPKVSESMVDGGGVVFCEKRPPRRKVAVAPSS